MAFLDNCVKQVRKLKGFPGKMMIKGINIGHAKMADWGLNHLKITAPEEIVDLGCGGGRNAGELLRRFPRARVTAIDYSPLSVEQAAQYNVAAVAAGARFEQMVGGMKTYTAEHIADALKAAGFSKVRIFHHKSKPWIAVLARK